MPNPKEFIGEHLVDKGLITAMQLKEALEEQKRSGGKLGEVLIRKGYISEDNFTRALSEQLGIPFVDVANYKVDPEAIKLFTLEMVQRYQAIPINKIVDALTVAMVDPLNILAVDEIKRSCGLTIRPVFATASGIKEAINKYYKTGEPSEEVSAYAQGAPLGPEVDLETLVKEADEAPVVTLVNSLFAEAIESGASDIHLEPEERNLYLRLRIDGVLQDIKPVTKDLEPAVISRIKILANMDIAERRLPQDGRIKMNILNREIDLRVSTFPTIYGENVSIRLLDKSQAIFKLEDLGFETKALDVFKEQIRRPYGIILVTGPTGSGKTTTLYASLNLINDLKKNIITLEDPIEYVIPRLRQSQVNVKAGLTFATGLRAILRQDPDIVMIGEIRDQETAEIAIHAALTGHLVFSTLHTNDAASAVGRLIDMGIEPFLVASALNAILAQRLVRRLCPKCKKPYNPKEVELASLGFSQPPKDITVYKEVGCSHCRLTGYKGRIGIFELLILDEGIKELILKKSPAHQIKEYAVKKGMRTLKDEGLEKLIGGVISDSEVLRVFQEV
jgi:type IV pilus assembly protein PilB